MQIIINEFGTFIGKKENCFEIKYKDKKEEYSADKIDQIKVICSSSLSSNAIKLAIDHNIDIIFLDKYGKPYARIYPCRLGGTTLTRRNQAEIYFTEKGCLLVKSFIKAKISNQLFLIKRLNKTRKNHFKEYVDKIEESLNKFNQIETGKIDDKRKDYLGFEGYVASLYFECLSKIVDFNNRDPKGKDIFNISLNYAYGILYSEVEKACIIAGLDPYLGFLHTDRYGKPSMVLDLIEQFRPIVDKAIIKLFVQKRIKDKDIEKIENNVILTKESRARIVEETLKALNEKVKYKGQSLTILQIIQEQAREIVRFFLEPHYEYNSFIWRD